MNDDRHDDALMAWRQRAEALRGDVVADPSTADFLAVICRQLGISTTCPQCVQYQLNQLLGDQEVYSYGAFVSTCYHWDIGRAKAIMVAQELRPITLTPAEGWALLDGHDAILDHVDHLPAAVWHEPIILAAALPNAQRRPTVLIDGTHRVLRALRDGTPIRAVLLDPAQSRAARVSDEEILATGMSLLDRLQRILRI